MIIAKQIVPDQIAACLRHGITRAQLVDWAENALMEGESQPGTGNIDRTPGSV